MENRQQQPSHSGQPEWQQPHIPTIEQETSTMDIQAQQALMDQLIALGFAWEEAVKVLYMRDHLCENPEMQQRMLDDPHLQFARWLLEQGEINEFPMA